MVNQRLAALRFFYQTLEKGLERGGNSVSKKTFRLP